MCDRIRMPNGAIAIVCARPRCPRKRCVGCGGVASYLCDHPTRSSDTCDAPLCAKCARWVTTNRHLCPKHRDAELQTSIDLDGPLQLPGGGLLVRQEVPA